MDKKIKSLQFIVIVIIAGLVGYFFGVNNVNVTWQNYKPSAHIVNKEAPATVSDVDFSTFWDVWQKLETNYYDKTKLDAKKMVNGAIEGMTKSLDDPYTVYLPPQENNDFKNGLAGQFSGIGAELGIQDKQIVVVAPLDESPAEKAGLKIGDAILKVNDESTSGWTLPTAVEKIRGPKGTTVTLTILHKNSDKPVDIPIVRDTITVKSVTGWVKSVKDIENIKETSETKGKENDEIAYARLSQFGDSTNNDWVSVINDLNVKLEKDENIKGLIIDLRNNPGGYLTDAVYISSEFLKQGTPVVLEEDSTGKRTTLSVTRKGLLYDIPLIVLINKGSASASEIVSGALRDNNRAILVGDVSFGKGTIQQAEDLGGGAGLHVTIAKWLTPNGTWVNGKGLKPDIEVSLNPKEPTHDTQLEKAVSELLK